MWKTLQFPDRNKYNRNSKSINECTCECKQLYKNKFINGVLSELKRQSQSINLDLTQKIAKYDHHDTDIADRHHLLGEFWVVETISYICGQDINPTSFNLKTRLENFFELNGHFCFELCYV